MKLIEYKCNVKYGCDYSFYSTTKERLRCPKCFRSMNAIKVIDVSISTAMIYEENKK